MRFLFLFFFLFLTANIFSQKSDLDSLKLRLAESGTASDLAVLLYSIGKETLESDPDSAIYFANQSKVIIDSLDLDSLRGPLNIVFSSAYSYKAEYDKSTQFAFDALSNAKDFNNEIVKYDAYTNLGIDFMYQEDYIKANEYFNIAKRISENIKSSYRLAHALNNLGMIAYYLGDGEGELIAYEKALILFQEIDEQEGIGNTLLNIGTWYTVAEQYQRAEGLYQQALAIFDKIGYKSAYGHTLESRAENFSLAGEMDKAISSANQALQLFIANDNKQDQVYCYKLLQEIYERQRNFRTAYRYQKKYQEVFEEIYDEEKAELVEDLHLKYATAKKETEIARLELSQQQQEQEISKARMQILMMIGSLVFIIVIAILFFVFLKKKQKADQLTQQLQLEALKKRFIELHASPSELAVSLDFEELNNKLHNPLTEREFEALKLSLEGKSNPEISDLLFISVSTVKFHLRNTYSKMGVGNRKEAFQYMLKTS